MVEPAAQPSCVQVDLTQVAPAASSTAPAALSPAGAAPQQQEQQSAGHEGLPGAGQLVMVLSATHQQQAVASCSRAESAASLSAVPRASSAEAAGVPLSNSCIGAPVASGSAAVAALTVLSAADTLDAEAVSAAALDALISTQQSDEHVPTQPCSGAADPSLVSGRGGSATSHQQLPASPAEGVPAGSQLLNPAGSQSLPEEDTRQPAGAGVSCEADSALFQPPTEAAAAPATPLGPTAGSDNRSECTGK